jgi:hypothetical protein
MSDQIIRRLVAAKRNRTRAFLAELDARETAAGRTTPEPEPSDFDDAIRDAYHDAKATRRHGDDDR